METAKTVVLITGAAGFLGNALAKNLTTDPRTPNTHLILTDIIKPASPASTRAIVVKADLTDSSHVNTLFETEFGVPDVVYALHGIMSRGSEDNFDLGMKVNIDATRLVLDAARHNGAKAGRLIKFVFASSLGVYGGPCPEIITPDTIASPEGAYGMEKLVCELIVNEYSRRGFVDGRILRLPTIVVRPGAPAAATSAFLSGIIREPLKGLEATCPIGTSPTSPEVSLTVWLASPETTLSNFIHASLVHSSSFRPHTRVVCLPGFTTTIREMLEALKIVGGEEALARVKFVPDETDRRLVHSWPSRIDNGYALGLGFVVDEGGMERIVSRFKGMVDMGLA